MNRRGEPPFVPANGPRLSAEMLRAAAEAGIPERTIHRAKQDTDVQSRRVTRDCRPEWYWYEPSTPFPPDAPFQKPLTRRTARRESAGGEANTDRKVGG